MKKQSFEDAIPTPQNFYFKLWKAKQAIGKVAKNSKNPHFKSSYADINAIIAEVEPVLLEYHLLLLQPIENGFVKTYIIDAETGENVCSEMKLPEILDPQRIGSAVTYYRRYTLQALLTLQSIDDDANLSSEAVKTQGNLISDERFQKALEAIERGDAKKTDLAKFQLTEVQQAKLNQL